MKNKCLAGARVSEAKFRLILRFFAADVPALTAAKLCAANHRAIYRLYDLLRQRVAFAKFRFPKRRGVRRDFFLLHLKECGWRFNHRGQGSYRLLLKHIRQKPFSAT